MSAEEPTALEPSEGGSMWRLYAAYGRENTGSAVLGTVMALVARGTGLVPALLLGLAIDAVLLDTRPFSLPLVPDAWMPPAAAGQLRVTVAVIVGATLLGAVASYLGSYGWNRFAQTVQHDLRTDAYEHLQAQDRAFFDSSRTGELLAVLNNDVNQLESFLTDGVNSGLRIVALVVGVGLVMLALNPWLALVSLTAVPVLVLFTAAFVRNIQPKYAAMRESVGDLNARLENNVGGIEVIKTEGAETYETERVRAASQSYYDTNWDAIRTRITFFPALSLISGLSFALTFAVGAFWVLNGPPTPFSGTVTAGAFVTFMLYTQQFIWPLAQFGQIVNSYQRARASSDRVYAVLEAEPGVREADEPVALPSVAGRVEYDDVTFSYDPEDAETPPVLRGVSFEVSPGDTVGIVGPTGSGKSTLVKLLVRLYDPEGGAVRIDGHDVRDVSIADLRRAVGYVAQEPFLFYGTVRENIAYGTFDADDDAIETAAHRAAAHEFVENLPEGYETMVGERGVKLSGGQRQRVALARTFLKEPEILVLDEATSHVDTETEAIIQRSLRDLATDRTTVAIAHRLSTVKDADTVMVLEGGRVVEQGTHRELLAENGLYANLWRVQAGDFEDLPDSFFEAAIARRAAIEGGGESD
ncbi:ABC transporter ATP-binding protein/permease [Haloarcula sp. S1CR25-12]|uniref:ABC transporter ATP-binding protein/permease n=1 Tax=Haloarcula saliterrae TaxID=2950534 RepID=A0ABU2FG98_9EURY|nr:ABC transporter ATP-binding protein [Haloarcula sp. S1CR25-12]MDS0260766.1 ABC transporter ATP-binding protein/permease [Haloarcula sp. S1CR25-12]